MVQHVSVVELLVDILLGAIIVGVVVALFVCIGAAVWAKRESPEREPWERPDHPENPYNTGGR